LKVGNPQIKGQDEGLKKRRLYGVWALLGEKTFWDPFLIPTGGGNCRPPKNFLFPPVGYIKEIGFGLKENLLAPYVGPTTVGGKEFGALFV